MTLNDPLASALSKLLNADKVGKTECIVKPVSNLLLEVLKIFKDNGYIKDFELVKDSKYRIVKVSPIGSINKCGVIKPRFPFKIENVEKFEKRYLPAKDFGILIVSTTKGIITHLDAKNKNIGGSLIAYCY